MRAFAKAAPYLESLNYFTGDYVEDELVQLVLGALKRSLRIARFHFGIASPVFRCTLPFGNDLRRFGLSLSQRPRSGPAGGRFLHLDHEAETAITARSA